MDAPPEKVNSEAAESMSATEKTDEREPRHCCPSDEGSVKSDCGEGPAVEGLLLLQHVSDTASPESRPANRPNTPGGSPERIKAPETEIDCTTIVNPIHQLLKTRNLMRVKDEVEQLGRFRGVFVLSKLSVYYSIIRTANHFHFLGFHHSAAAAAQAWDLAALKRAMSNSQSLSTARTNFRMEDYGRLESVLSLMVILRFDELVDMFKDLHPDLGTADNMREVQKTIEDCKMSFEDELGNVAMPAEAKEDGPAVQAQTCTSDEIKDMISSSCKGSTHNSWVKNIRDSKKWKGVYFSRDGVPYSKVEFGGKYHYLGRFDTLEGAARAYDLATLKRAMMNRQSIVSLNFAKEDYVQDRQLMKFLYFADSEQVSSFIRMLAHNQRACSMGDHYGRGRSASKRQKLDGPTSMAAFRAWGRKPAESSLQRIDWEGLGLDKEKAPAHDILLHNNEQSGEREENEMDIDEETSDPTKRQEMKVERRICDANMAALLRDSRDWVRVALNAVALKMTHANITVTTEHVLLPSDVAEWFGAISSNAEGPHAVELSNACGKQTFRFMCSLAKDHCRFSATVWNQFVDEIGLTIGDILVLLKSNALWKLSYAVFVLPDAVVADSFSQSIPLGGRKLPKMPSSMYIPPSAAIRPSVTPPAPPARRTLHANVLSDAQHLTEIKILQKTQDGRLLVEAGLVRDPMTGIPADPTKRALFVIPANAVHAAPMIRTPAGFVALHGQPFPPPGNKRFVCSSSPQYVHPSNPRAHRTQRPACLPSVPIRLNIRGGVNALAKKTDRGLFMVTDAHGQMRLVTSQAPSQHSAGRTANHLQPVNYSHPLEAEPAVGYPCQVFPNDSQRNTRSTAAADRVSHTSPDITVIDPSTTGSDASGTGTEKPLTHPAQQEEHSSQKNIIDLVEEDEKEPDSEKQGDNLPDMYTHITKIIEECQTIDPDTAKKYKFAFVNKMTQGQQTANFMELKNLSHAGEWSEVAEWIKKTVENLT